MSCRDVLPPTVVPVAGRLHVAFGTFVPPTGNLRLWPSLRKTCVGTLYLYVNIPSVIARLLRMWCYFSFLPLCATDEQHLVVCCLLVCGANSLVAIFLPRKVSSEASEEAEEGSGTSVGGCPEKITAVGEGATPKQEGGDGGAAVKKEEGHRHRLSNVNFINMGRVQKIKCVVDNQVAVDIGANQVGDIATVALLEETDQLLGKDHLFKRSLLLIKVLTHVHL